MALPEFEKAVKNVGAKKEILGSKETPFRIPYAFEHKEFMDKLLVKEELNKRITALSNFGLPSMCIKLHIKRYA